MQTAGDVTKMLLGWYHEGVRVLYLQTYNETEAWRAIAGLADGLELPFWQWSQVRGLVRSGDLLSGQLTRDPEVLVDKVLGMDEGIVLAYDLLLHPLTARAERALKELSHQSRKTLLVVTGPAHMRVPESLSYDVVTWSWGDMETSALYGWSKSPLSTLAVAAQRQQIAMPGLELLDSGAGWDIVGGLSNLKNWAHQRKLAINPSFDLPFPRGVLLAGIPGTGKSLSVRAWAGDWNLPLFRLNWSGIMGRYVGQSEAQLTAAIASVEKMAPAILWIDEIDKSISAGDSGSDGGVSRRLLGWLLTWLQEHDRPVMLLATANQVDTLPSELLRPGRFDALFFVDLPNQEAREEILRIQLKNSPVRDVADFAGVSETWTDFSGADIQEAVLNARFLSAQMGKALTPEVLCEAGNLVIPWARTLHEEVERRRSWAKGRMYQA